MVIGTAQQLRRLPDPVPTGVLVQLRDKALPGRSLFDAALELSRRGVPLVVNSRADVARAAGALGVHLPADGLPAQAVRGWWPEALIGCSTHDVAEVNAAVAGGGASYLTAGPVYPTGDKAVIGLDGLRRLCAAAGQTPVLALGGVTPERVDACEEVGAAGVACIRAVWGCDDPGLAIDRFLP